MKTDINSSKNALPVEWDRARLDLIDAFFQLELQVGKWCLRVGKCDVRTSFGNKLETLATNEKIHDAATPNQAKYFARLREECAEPLRIRNAIIHSRVRPGHDEGVEVALFETVTLALEGDGAVIPIRLNEVIQATKNAKTIAGKLGHFLDQNMAPKALPNPPSLSCPATAKYPPSGISAPSRS